MALRTIYGDEAGNTGPDLLDAAQPVFALAFTDFTREEATELLSTVSTKADEVHLADMLRRKGGVARLRPLFDHPAMQGDRTRCYVVNKEHMIVTKIIDLLVENVAHRAGFDLYRDGLNIVLGNRMYAALHALVGPEQRREFLLSFANMVRMPSTANTQRFYESAKLLLQRIEPQYREACEDFFVPIFASEAIAGDIIQQNDKYTFDPIIPSAFSLAYEWSRKYPDGLALVHDDAKTLKTKEADFRLFMSERLEGLEVGYDSRRHPARLPIREISFASSTDEPAIQIADVVAGVTMRAFAARVGNRAAVRIAEDLDDLQPARFLAGGIWPLDEYTADEVGVKYEGGIHPVNVYSELLSSGTDPAKIL